MGSKRGLRSPGSADIKLWRCSDCSRPTYPIHYQAFILAGANVEKMELIFDENSFEVDEDRFISDLKNALDNSLPKAKFLVLNFPHNPTTCYGYTDFYQEIVALAKEKRFYIISDIAYADITFDGYKTPSILELRVLRMLQLRHIL